jgi:hypothetical protein
MGYLDFGDESDKGPHKEMPVVIAESAPHRFASEFNRSPDCIPAQVALLASFIYQAARATPESGLQF